MSIRIPSPGTFTPDVASGGGLLGGLLIVLILGGMIADGLSRSGAGEVGRRNYVLQTALCTPNLESVGEYNRRAKEAYDRGLPDTLQMGQQIAEAIGARVVSPGANVTVVESSAYQGASYSRVAEASQAPCWMLSGRLKMGWIEWTSWQWSKYRAEAAREAQVEQFKKDFQTRWSQVPTKLVACQTGTLHIDYSGLGYENATPVDLSRCYKSGGSVSIKGAPGGFIYYPDGTGSDSTDHVGPNRAQMLFAGPAGTRATLDCRCPLRPGESRSGTSPETVILNLFDAFRADDRARVNEFMGSAGRDSARLFCPGKGDEAPYSCLVKNYQDLGTLTKTASSGETSYSSATVSLKTTWTTDDGSTKELCQRFKLGLTDEEWKVDFFGEPGTCGQRH